MCVLAHSIVIPDFNDFLSIGILPSVRWITFIGVIDNIETCVLDTTAAVSTGRHALTKVLAIFDFEWIECFGWWYCVCLVVS